MFDEVRCWGQGAETKPCLNLTESDGNTCGVFSSKIDRYGKNMWISLKKYDFFVLTNMYQVYIICGGGGFQLWEIFPSIWSQWVSTMTPLDVLETLLLQGVVGVFTIITDGRFRSSSFATRRLWRKILWRRTTVVSIFWIHSRDDVREQKVFKRLFIHKFFALKGGRGWYEFVYSINSTWE